ncbi:MAG: NTF2-like N-terminal transpeptidase domain-containing protein, partial [Streptosporangiaceae bacterium]
MLNKARRIVAASVGLVLAGTTVSACAEQSPFSAVKNFLVAWQVKNYDAAAKHTTGDRAKVAAALRGVNEQLDAASLHLSLKGTVTNGGSTAAPGAKQEGRIDRQGEQAQARFQVRIDLGENGALWSYGGLLPLKRIDGRWKVVWSPAVIHPSLREGDRLGVITEYPERKMILDRSGRPLLKNVKTDLVGVIPGQIRDIDATVKGLNQATKQDAARLKGRILSAPPLDFLQLATVPDANQAVVAQLQQVPGLVLQIKDLPQEPLQARELIGSVAPATSDLLSKVGAPYQPGDTVGSSGLQLLFQRRLAGVPTVKVIAINAAGKQKGAPLAENPGLVKVNEDPAARQARTVTTTIAADFQARAERTLKKFGLPGSLVTVEGQTGSVLAAANYLTGTKNVAFEGEYGPGMTFSPIIASSLLGSGGSVTDNQPCEATASVGGQDFTANPAPKSNLSLNLARGCSTAFARLGGSLPVTDFATAMKKFGLDLQWDMSQVPHFQASGITPITDAARAETAVGLGDVRVSPLTMALAAGAIQNATWHEPGVILNPDPTTAVNQRFLGTNAYNGLKTMMKAGAKMHLAQNPKAYDGAVVATGTDAQGKPVSWFMGYKGS